MLLHIVNKNTLEINIHETSKLKPSKNLNSQCE